MGLFDKKYCDICGGKIGLLGNKKLENGNLCKDCAAKLSPWFKERRHTTKEEIIEQLQYREANQSEVAQFRVSRSLGRGTKLLLDENSGKFMITSAKDLEKANPDVLTFSQVTGCDVSVDENRSEIKRADKDGKQVSYNPPRYEYSYNFYVTVYVNHPYFDQMRFTVNNGAVNTGQRPVNATAAGISAGANIAEYNECLAIANEIKDTLTRAREATHAPKTAVTCPWCGATTFPDAAGRCEYCGGSLNN